MANQVKKKKPWLKRILIVVMVLVVVLAGVYWYYATEKFSDTTDRESSYTVNALDLIHEFIENDSAANKKYTEKIITVNGRISELEAPDTSTVNVKFIDPATGSFAIFAFQDTHLAEGKNLKAGDSVSIKGSCSGGVYSAELELTKIDFKRAALNKQ
jgi:tRNA_anti-like